MDTAKQTQPDDLVGSAIAISVARSTEAGRAVIARKTSGYEMG